MSAPALRTESLLKLAWPIFLQNTAHSVVVLVDFWFFSHLGNDVAATVSQLLPVIWMGAFVIPTFAGTGVSVASQFIGAKQFEKVVPAYLMNLALTGTMGVAYAAFLWLFAGDIGRWLGMDAGFNGIATAYLGNMSGYFVFLGVLVSYNAVLSSRGMTNWTMYSSLTIAALNLVLASLFTLGFRWGVPGVCAASVISVAVAMAISIWLVHGKLGVSFRVPGALRTMAGVFQPMLRLGISNALEPFSYTTQRIIISMLIISLGVTSMAADGYAGRAQMFQITFSFSLALGAQILMAHWMGARRFDDVNQLYWRAIRRAMLVAFVYAATVWIFADPVLSIFTNDPDARQLGKTLLLIAVFYEPARAVNIIGGFALKTVGDARFPMVVAIIFIWGILPVVYFIKHTWGISLVALWMCFAADEIIRAGINLWRWRSGRWKDMGLAQPAAVTDANATPDTTLLPVEP